MLTITPAATIPEIIKDKFTTEPAKANAGYTSAFYAIDTKNKYKYLVETLPGAHPWYVITAEDAHTKYIITLKQHAPHTVDIISAEVYKDKNPVPTRREESPRLLKKYSVIACLLYGLIKNGAAPAGTMEENPETITTGIPYPVILYRVNAAARFMILTKNNSAWIDGPAAELEAHKNEIRKTEPAAAFTDENGARYVFRTYSAWTTDAAILREYTITAATEEAAQETARALAAGQPYSINKAYTPAEDPEPVKAANETPKRRQAWRVECRSPRGTWTAYSEEQPTREDAARIMEEAETRHTLTPDGAPIFYRIAQIDKGPETAPENVKTDTAGDTTTTPETAPTTNGITPGEESPTAPENEPQRAAETPKRPTDGETPAADHTTPPQATQEAGTDPGTPTGAKPAEPGPVTDSGRTTAAKTTGAAPPGPNTPQEAPPNDYRTAQTAPPRHETTKAAQTTTRSNKGPPRAKQDDKTSRTSETRINTDILRFLAKVAEKPNTCSPRPNFVPKFL